MADDKAAHDRALEMFVYAPVGVALYVRDMLPTMMGIFVSRGKREVQSHLPGQTPPAPPIPPIPPAPSPADMRRRLEEGIGLARVVAEGGVGVAKGVAGSGIGIARDLAGTAVQGLGAIRENPPASPASSSPAHASPTAAPASASPAPAAQAPSVPSANAMAGTPTPSAPNVSSPGPVISGRAPVVDGGTAASAGVVGEAAAPPVVGALAIPDYDELSASQVVERLEGLDPASLDAIRRYETAHRGRNTILGKIAQLT